MAKGKIIQLFTDSLTNLVSKMGTSRDKAYWNTYEAPELTDLELMAAYRGSWLPRKIVDIPALDSCRNWRDWQADIDQIEAIEEEEDRLGLKGKVLEARIKARLFGGAAIFIGTGTGNPAQELTTDSVRKQGIQYLNVFPKSLLQAGQIDQDPVSPTFGKPIEYKINEVAIHPSRLVLFLGGQYPDETLNPYPGWGESVLIPAMKALKNADGTADNVASMVFESIVDVIRIPDFMASLSEPGYQSKMMERYTLAAQTKGVNGMLILDKEEEYEKKSSNFSTLPQIMETFLQIISGAADIPVTRLLGQSPSGLNSTGESDLRNYYDRIAAAQRLEMTPAMKILDECLIHSALGSRPPEIYYTWASLWMTTDRERMDIGKVISSIIKEMNDTGLYPPEAVAKAGANMMSEASVMPGFDQDIEDAGGLPDYEAEAEEALQLARGEGGGPAPADGGQENRDWLWDYSPDQPRVPAGDPDGGQWTSEGGSSSSGEGGGSTSAGLTPEQAAEIDKKMKKELIELGNEDGHEHLTGYDLVTGEVYAPVSDGMESAVQPSPEMLAAMTDPNSQLIMHHNHPPAVPSSLSDGDLSQLYAPGVKGIWAHGSDGSSYYAERLTKNTNPSVWWNAAANMSMNTIGIMRMTGASKVTSDDLSLSLPHLLNSILADEGVIKYKAELGPIAKAAYQKTIVKGNIGKVIRAMWEQEPIRFEARKLEAMSHEEFKAEEAKYVATH